MTTPSVISETKNTVIRNVIRILYYSDPKPETALAFHPKSAHSKSDNRSKARRKRMSRVYKEAEIIWSREPDGSRAKRPKKVPREMDVSKHAIYAGKQNYGGLDMAEAQESSCI
jgi:hypothetical protein